MNSSTFKIFHYSALIAGLSLLVGCGNGDSVSSEENAERSFRVSLATVEKGSWERRAQAVGSLLAENQTTLRTAQSGHIRELHFDEGDMVSKGDLIVKLDDDLLQLELQRAAAILEDSETEFQRQQRLFESEGVSEASLIRARTARDRAVAEKGLVKRRIQDSRISAPFDGQLGRRMVSVGDFLNVGEALFELTSTERLRLEFSLPEKYLRAVSIGQQIEFSTASFPGELFSGEVFFIDPRVDPRARTIRMRAWVPNEEGRLKPNMFGRISLALGEISDAIIIHEEALVTDLGGFFVYVIDEDDRSRMRQVVPEEREGGLVWLAEGVSEGDRIVRSGHQRISDGSKVTWDDSE